MGLDASIILGYKAPQIMSGDERLMNALKIKSAQSEDSINQLKIKDYNDKANASNELKAYLRANPKATSADLANQGYFDQAKDLGGIEQQGNLNQAAQFKSAKEHMGFYTNGLGEIIQSATPRQDSANFINQGMQFGTIKPEMGQQLLAHLNDPNVTDEQIKQSAAAMFQQAQDHDKQFTAATKDAGGQIVPTLQNNTTGALVQGAGAIDKTQTPESIASNQTTATQGDLNRQNQLNIAGMKQDNGAPMSVMGADGRPTLVSRQDAIGKQPYTAAQDAKQVGAYNADTAALSGSTNSFDRLAQAANEVLNAKGLAGITGIKGALPNIPGSEAADAQAKLDTLKSQVGFGVLQDMRNNSKTGGALGAVSDAEGKRLEANLAALPNAQSETQIRDSLKKIMDYADQAKGRMHDAFNLKHGENGNQYQGDGIVSTKPNQASKQIVKTGTHNGKKVVQYSDGTISYAQ